MKKIILRTLLTLILIFPICVLAKENISVTPSSLTVEEGSTKTITITVEEAEIITKIESSNDSVAIIDKKIWETGETSSLQTKAQTITVTGKSAGNATISFIITGSNLDGDELSETKTVSVTVEAKSQPKSTNNKIKTISVDGYKLTKEDDQKYSLNVVNNVTSIKVKLEAEDSKAKVEGAGSKELDVGENKIELSITSESGDVNKITLLVTRKDSNSLEDLEELLKNKNNDTIEIDIKSNTKITEEDLKKIRTSRKKVIFNCYNNSKKLIYSWTVDGNKLTNGVDFNANVDFDKNNVMNILNKTDNAEGIYFNIEQNKLPKGISLKVYVGDKYKDKDKINLYTYGNDKVILAEEKVTVKDGYVEVELADGGEYLFTLNNITKDDKKELNIFLIISIAEFIIIVGLLLCYFIKIKPRKNKKDKNTEVLEENIENDIVKNMTTTEMPIIDNNMIDNNE